MTPLLGSMSALPIVAAVAATALIPLAGALGGLVLALTAPLAIAGAGATLFGFLASFAAKDAIKQQKNIDQLKTKLAGLKKGTAEYAATLGQLKTAQAKQSPAARGFIGAIDAVKKAFARLPQGALFGPLTAGLRLLTNLMPAVVPLIRTVSHVLTGLLDELGRATKSPGFKAFMGDFVKQLGPDLTILGHIAGNVLKGLGSMFMTTGDQLSGGLLKYLEKLSESFANIGQSNGFQSFLDWVKTNGPRIWHDVTQIAEAVGLIIKRAAPLGSLVLHGLGLLAEGLNKLENSRLGWIVRSIGPFGLVGSLSAIANLAPKVGSVLASAFGVIYDVVRSVWNNALRPFVVWVGGAFGGLMGVWASLLDLLSHVPGFGWAKGAAKAMHEAADAAANLGTTLGEIPDRHVEVDTTAPQAAGPVRTLKALLDSLKDKTVTITTLRRITGVTKFGQAMDAQHRAAGGPTLANTLYEVGEHGSELFMSTTPGRILSHGQSQQMIAAANRSTALAPAPAGSATGAFMGRASVSIGDMDFEGYINALIDDRMEP